MSEKEIAYHEAGHCVALHEYNIPIVHTKIVDENNGETPPQIGVAFTEEILCVTYLAGAAAEFVFFGVILPGGSGRDFRKCLMRVSGSEEKRAAYLDKSKAIIRKHRAAVEKLAAAILEKRCLEGPDIEAIIGAAR